MIDTKDKVGVLVERLQNGSEEAFSEIYDMYSPALYGVIHRMVNDEELAQDVLQESFVTIWKKANMYSPGKGTFFTWMLNVSRNKAIDYLRKINREGTGKSNFQQDLVMGQISASIPIDQIGLNELVNKLSDDHKLIIDYLYFRGYTQQEASDELGIPMGTIKSRLRAALNVLRGSFVIAFVLWILKTL
jgi:RNA polymerase sigma-70 factor, ECF subfamily